MSKKHFIALAEAIRAHNRTCESVNSIPFDRYQLDVLAKFLAEQNPRFNYQKWIDFVNRK